MRALTQNEREQYSHIMRFRESFSDFPEGLLCFDDNPDVLVKTSDRMLGIEHTRLYWGNLKEQESLEQRIVDRAREMYEASGGPPLAVNVLFDPKVRLGVREIDSIAASLNRLVCRYVPNVGGRFDLEGWRFASRELSRAFRRIFIDRPSDPCEILWGVGRGGAVPHLSPDSLRESIQGKESKVGRYFEKCSKIWLLIVEDGFAPSSYFVISDEVEKEIYKSKFDRIFLFRNFSREVIELKVEP